MNLAKALAEGFRDRTIRSITVLMIDVMPGKNPSPKLLARIKGWQHADCLIKSINY